MQNITLVFPAFLLIFCRITAFFVVAPIFSTRSVPLPLKIGLSFFITLLVFFAIGINQPVAWDAAYVLLILREVLIGLLLGFIAYLFFTVVQVAGSFIDMQMGFGIANVIDPMTGAQSPLLGNFKFMIAILLFLSMNGHHYLIMAIMRSYDFVPIANPLFGHIASGDISSFLLKSLSTMFALAFQMAAPIVVSLFLVDVALGILARTVPQLNIFVVGMPIKVGVGFLILIIMVPSFLYLFKSLFSTMFDSIQNLLLLIK